MSKSVFETLLVDLIIVPKSVLLSRPRVQQCLPHCVLRYEEGCAADHLNRSPLRLEELRVVDVKGGRRWWLLLPVLPVPSTATRFFEGGMVSQTLYGVSKTLVDST